MKRYFFIGIGGSGMSALAFVLRQRGCWVGGSDRNWDNQTNKSVFNILQGQGIVLTAQGDQGVIADLDGLVVSTAIEDDHPQLVKARRLQIPVVHRARLLAELFNSARGIGIAGTSGKSTVTGMVAAVLEADGKEPTVINGGSIKAYCSEKNIGNAKCGRSDLLVAEIDESDGSIIHFSPEIGVVTNISKDHKEMSELRSLFQTFGRKTQRQFIVNGDCAETQKSLRREAVTFGLGERNQVRAEKTEPRSGGSTFSFRDAGFELQVPGIHNVYNALAAIAVGQALGISLSSIQRGLAAFSGIKRRLDLVGRCNDIAVFDDFAHNPDKISASLAALKAAGTRVLVVFQPHGYGPTRFLLEELGQAFSAGLTAEDYVSCLNIYDAGGTANRDISSRDILAGIAGPQTQFFSDRQAALICLVPEVRPGDTVVVMGARDDTLSDFAHSVFRAIKERYSGVS
ncbi:MAG: UDP-N-acetylmuramate--L-alanine ligase [Deltaproteobacteria bacterium]|nr:UDP-N-acetylmuramate--L-alanine ligase [Deltaproteobacteria bacterium]